MSKKKVDAPTKAKQAKLLSMHMAYPLSKMKPYGKNPRNHEDTIDLLVRSLGIFGAIAPIVLREDGTIAAGHARYKASQKQGRKTFPAIKVKFVDEEAFIAYVMTDNQIATRSTWISAEFGELHDQLDAAGWMPEDTGFDPDMIPEIRAADLGLNEGGGNTDPDDVPDPPKVATSKTGDLYILGDHRVLCGDATKPEDVKRLMDGAAIDLFLIDPPYCSGGFQESGKAVGSVGTEASHRKIVNDRLSTRGFSALIRSALSNVNASFFYCFTDWKMWTHLFDVSESSGYGVRSMIVWDKGTAGMGRGWRSQHELILWGCKDVPPYPKKFPGAGNVLTVQRSGNVNHTTEKPTELIVNLLSNTPFAKTVVDTFLGSGTTLIACEQLNRKCYGMEIEPFYVDVIVKRWETFTGLKAKLIREGARG